MKRLSLLLLFSLLFAIYLATSSDGGAGNVSEAASIAALTLLALLGFFAMKRSLRGYSPRKFTPQNCSTS